MGRPLVNIDPQDLTRLGRLCPTLDEVAAYFGCSRRTIERRFKDEPDLYETFEAGKAMGRLAVRRKQMQILEENDNPIMAIWLGKQLLGQRDKHDVVAEDRRSTNLAEAFNTIKDITQAKKQMELESREANGTALLTAKPTTQPATQPKQNQNITIDQTETEQLQSTNTTKAEHQQSGNITSA